MQLLYAVLNPIVKGLLKSPLHPVMSGNTMLITYRGRRSGKVYELPVSYARDGEHLRAFAARGSKWWRNLADGAEVELRIAGRRVGAHASVEQEDRDAIAEGLGRFLRVVPRDAGPAGVRLASDGSPNTDDLASAAERTVAVLLTPRGT